MDIPFTSKPRPDTGLYNAKVGIWLFLASEVMLFGALFSSYVMLRIGADPGRWVEGVLDIPMGTVNTVVLIFSSLAVLQAWASLKMQNIGRFKLWMGLTILCAGGFMVIKSFEYTSKFKHYEVWFKDASRPSVTGHIEGDPWFWSTETLDEQGIEVLKFHPDSAHEEADHQGEQGHADSGEVLYAASEEHVDDGSHGEEDHGHTLDIPRDEILRLSAFVPAHSTYFAIYFTMTGLHALHVVGGALVLAYFLLPGIGMWKTDPTRFTNRVEVGGLFWHFVDLVWIFLFPILYLL